MSQKQRQGKTREEQRKKEDELLGEHLPVFKCIILGNSGVGKTSLVKRHHFNTFDSAYCVTIGGDFYYKAVTLGGDKIILQVWDTAGAEQHKTFIQSYFREVDAVILAYDLTKSSEVEPIESWLNLYMSQDSVRLEQQKTFFKLHQESSDATTATDGCGSMPNVSLTHLSPPDADPSTLSTFPAWSPHCATPTATAHSKGSGYNDPSHEKPGVNAEERGNRVVKRPREGLPKQRPGSLRGTSSKPKAPPEGSPSLNQDIALVSPPEFKLGVVVVGTKLDLVEGEQYLQRGRREESWAYDHGWMHFATSAKSGKAVGCAFTYIAQELIRLFPERLASARDPNGKSRLSYSGMGTVKVITTDGVPKFPLESTDKKCCTLI